MGLRTGLAPNTVLSGIDKMFYSKFNEKPGPQMATVEDGSLFQQESVGNRGVQTEVFMDAGKWEERTSEHEDLSEGTAKAGFSKTFTVANYAQTIPIPKHYFDDEMYGTVKETINKMALKGKLTKLSNGIGLYRGAFDSTTTNEGSYLISDSHTNLNGDTIDNKETAALEEGALNALIIKLIEQKDQRGDVVGFEPSCLLVTPTDYKLACEITESELRSGTADNDMNVYSSKYGIMIKQSNYLGAAGGGDDDYYFLMAKEHPVHRWVREAVHTELVDYKYADNFVYKYKAEFREVYGAHTYEGIVGSDGSV